MDNCAGLIEWHTSANIQGEIGDTYNAAQDEATQGVFVSQSKIGKHSCFVLRYSVTVDHGINTCDPQNCEQLTNEDAELRPTRPDA